MYIYIYIYTTTTTTTNNNNNDNNTNDKRTLKTTSQTQASSSVSAEQPAKNPPWVTANCIYLSPERLRDFLGTPVNFVFPNMPGRTLFRSGKIHYFRSGPVSVDPSCP